MISNVKPSSEPERGAVDSPRLCVKGLSKRFVSPESGKDFVALQDVNFEAPDKEFICLLGPSGCGKTTLLNMIAGFTEPSGGELLISGRPVAGAGPDRGVVFQDYALFPWLSVRRNVQFGPRVAGMPVGERDALADKYLDMVGLSEFSSRYPHQLSGGMKQRVAIARALANRPSMLLMDEPFGALDAMTREMMQDELFKISQLEPKLIIFVTHSVLEAVFLADRVLVMASRPGRVVADLRIGLDRPRDRTSPEVAGYVREIRDLLNT